MNTAVLRSKGFWLSAVTVIAGLMISSGLVLDGTTVDMVIGWVLSIVGVIGGHKLAGPTETPPAA